MADVNSLCFNVIRIPSSNKNVRTLLSGSEDVVEDVEADANFDRHSEQTHIRTMHHIMRLRCNGSDVSDCEFICTSAIV